MSKKRLVFEYDDAVERPWTFVHTFEGGSLHIKPGRIEDAEPEKPESPIPPPVRLEVWEMTPVFALSHDGWNVVAETINKQIAHLRARKERGEDV